MSDGRATVRHQNSFTYFCCNIINLAVIQEVKQAIEKISDRDAQRQDSKPVCFEQWQPFVTVGEALVLDKFSKEDVAPDRAQPEGDRIKNQPEDDVFCCYSGPVFLLDELNKYRYVSKRWRKWGVLGWLHQPKTPHTPIC